MTKPVLVAVAVIAAALAWALGSTAREPTDPVLPPPVVDRPAAPQPITRVQRPSVSRSAERAMRWQLAAETGTRRTLPARTFTARLERELTSRPPRPQPGHARARLGRVREIQPVPGARRVLVTVHRGASQSTVTLLLVCRRRCLVASIE